MKVKKRGFRLRHLIIAAVLAGVFCVQGISVHAAGKSVKQAKLSGKPAVSVSFKNYESVIKWTRVNGAQGYVIFRKNGKYASYRAVASVSAAKTSYTDIYRNTFTLAREKSQLVNNCYLDVSASALTYTVRAYKTVNGQKVYSDYLKDGVYSLETPCIISVKKNGNRAVFKWNRVSNADKYYLYCGRKKKNGGISWKRVKQVKQKKSKMITASAKVTKKSNYFTVKAVSVRNGKTVSSSFDAGYTIKNRKYGNKNILYLGDSITYGIPYASNAVSYPWRVAKLTGASYYNPSIPSATYAKTDSAENRDCITTQVAKRIKNGKSMVINTNKTYAYRRNKKHQKFKDFDVVVLAAGTNDYTAGVKLGSQNSKDIKTFNGALNTIMSYIKEGSEKRVANGQKPIKVVFVNLFYGQGYPNGSVNTSRFSKANSAGLTLKDYQRAINKLVHRYKNDGMKVYQFKTSSYVNSSNCFYVTVDNLHMNKSTYMKIGNGLAEFLVRKKIL